MGFSEEKITITTYYPSPYGSYNELGAKRIAIGDTYYNNSGIAWDDADLLVEGNLGIGTLSPVSKLAINGSLGVGLDYATKAAPENGAIIQGNVGIGTDSPVSNLAVNGSLGVGSDYATKAAPENGAIIQGNVGIGTDSPAAGVELDVAGDIAAEGLSAENITTVDLSATSNVNINNLYIDTQLGAASGTAAICYETYSCQEESATDCGANEILRGADFGNQTIKCCKLRLKECT